MTIIVVDVEHTTTVIEGKLKDFSPYNSNNRIVSVHWALIENGNISPPKSLRLIDDDVDATEFVADLTSASAFVNHNVKHDYQWLKECGFNPPSNLRCTMVRESIINRGVRADLDLDSVAVRYDVTRKLDVVKRDYFDKGLSAADVPWEILKEYGEADVKAAAEIFLRQEILLAMPNNVGLIPTVNMVCEFTKTLADMERNGVKIDTDALAEVEQDYLKQQRELQEKLKVLTRQLMGDKPHNLASVEDLSAIVYSRRVNSKEKWKEVFNLGVNARGKPLKRPRMSAKDLAQAIEKNTYKVHKSTVEQCPDCSGKGYFTKVKKNGEDFNKPTRCKTCEGNGVIYKDTKEIAGLQFKCTDISDIANAGFSTDKEVLRKLIIEAKQDNNQVAVEFLESVIKLNAVDTYLSSFVNGIKKFTQKNGVLHARFNQHVTATGRLSGSEPNLQNQPRGNTFPIRKVFVSRWNNVLIDVDMGQLEFRCAVHLARDENGRKDIENGIDVHMRTSKWITENGQPINRQEAKSHTFKPLYGGMSGTKAEMSYYSGFLTDMHPGIGKWHEVLQDKAINAGKITLPTGREYAFPYVTRNAWGNATQKTQIVNYPVQGFATADIVPMATIVMEKAMKKRKLKSLLVLTVHDSLVIDVYPGEEDVCVELAKKFAEMGEWYLKTYHGIDMFVPLACEVKMGPNLLEAKTV